MIRTYIIKKMFNVDGKKRRCYLGGYIDDLELKAFFNGTKENAMLFTLDNGNAEIVRLNKISNDNVRFTLVIEDLATPKTTVNVLKARSADTEKQFMITDFNDLKIKDITKENDMNNLYRIREVSTENFGFEIVKWLQNAPSKTVAPTWSHVSPARAGMFNWEEGNNTIALLKDNRMIDYEARYELVSMGQDSQEVVDDAVDAFDRAFKVL